MVSLTEQQIRDIKAEELRRNPRNRRVYWVAHLADGRQISEHICNWANVPILQVVMLELTVHEAKYLIKRSIQKDGMSVTVSFRGSELSFLVPNFLGFVQFKTALRGLRGTPGVPDKIESRCIGWTTDDLEYVLRIDEKTHLPAGPIEVHTKPEGKPPLHLHPLLLEKWKESQI